MGLCPLLQLMTIPSTVSSLFFLAFTFDTKYNSSVNDMPLGMIKIQVSMPLDTITQLTKLP